MPALDEPRFRENLGRVRERVDQACRQAGRAPEEVAVVAVTKGHGPEVMQWAVHAGLRDLGENRVQEALGKLERMPAGGRLHLLGQLQKNKVNKAVGVFASIASVDRGDLLDRIARRARQLEIVQPIWMQVNVTGEPQKGGCEPADAARLWEQALAEPALEPVGLMTLGKQDAGELETRQAFAQLAALGRPLRRRKGKLAELSMGMSGDFEWAVLEGSTQLRLGTVLFGPRALS